MDEKQKQAVQEEYKKAKEKGVLFFPDLLAKDAIVAFLIFLVLIALAYFLGAPLEPRADPGDSNYTPRPEWYFLFLFQMLKYFPGDLEVIGVIVIPTLAVLFLLLLPFLDRGTKRHFWNRKWVIGVTLVGLIGVVGLTIQSIRETPPPAEAQGGDPTAILYTENCAGCHGSTIEISEGTNLHTIIAQGQHNEGMPAWSGDLTSDEIDALAGAHVMPSKTWLPPILSPCAMLSKRLHLSQPMPTSRCLIGAIFSPLSSAPPCSTFSWHLMDSVCSPSIVLPVTAMQSPTSPTLATRRNYDRSSAPEACILRCPLGVRC
jgi:hypothetical protein